MTKKEAKAETVEGQDVDKEPETVTTPEPEAIVTPETEVEGKGKEPSENLEQRYKTLEGMFKKNQTELNLLKKERVDLEGLHAEMKSQNQTLNLITEALGEMATDNEGLQNKIQERKQAEKRQVEAKETFEQISGIAKIVNITPDDESLKPAREAFTKGDFKGAVKLTMIAAETKAGSLKFPKTVEPVTTEPVKETQPKKKLPVNTSTPAPSVDWREKPSKEKISEALKEIRENQ